jgi:hypothetical protein
VVGLGKPEHAERARRAVDDPTMAMVSMPPTRLDRLLVAVHEASTGLS